MNSIKDFDGLRKHLRTFKITDISLMGSFLYAILSLSKGKEWIELRRFLRKRINQRSKNRVFAYNPEWENCDYWGGLNYEERQKYYLKRLEKDRRKRKISAFFEKVKVEDFEKLYKKNTSFRQLVNKTSY